MTVVGLSPDGGVPVELLSLSGACSLAQQLFLSSPFPNRKDPYESKTCCYQAARAPILPAHWLMPMVEMMIQICFCFTNIPPC